MSFRPAIEPEAVEKLKQLTNLTDAEVNKFAEVGRLVHIPAGWAMISEGTPADNAYFILDGSVSVRRDGQEIASVGEGEFLGEGRILNKVYRSAQVITSTPLTALAFTPEEGRALASEIPTLGQMLSKLEAERSQD